jgi:hypothetical protein
MDKMGKNKYQRLPLGMQDAVVEYAKQNGITMNQAFIHLVAQGLHYRRMVDSFHIANYTESELIKQ